MSVGVDGKTFFFKFYIGHIILKDQLILLCSVPDYININIHQYNTKLSLKTN